MVYRISEREAIEKGYIPDPVATQRALDAANNYKPRSGVGARWQVLLAIVLTGFGALLWGLMIGHAWGQSGCI